MTKKDCIRFLKKLDVIEAALYRGNEQMALEQIRRFRQAIICTFANN